MPALAGSLLALSACNKEEAAPTNAQTNNTSLLSREGGYEVVNGRLAFKDTAAFRVTMDKLVAGDMTEVRQWDEANGIASLREKYDRLESDTVNEVSIDQLAESGQLLWVPDARFASVLNEAGVVQVGDKIYKIEQHTGHTVPANKEELLINASWTSPEVENYEIKFEFSKEDNRPLTTVTDPSTGTPVLMRQGDLPWGQTEESTEVDINGNTLPKTWNGRPTRLKCIQWKVYWLVYNSIGMKTRYQKKTRAGWWSAIDASWIKCGGTFFYTLPVVPYGLLRLATGTDEKQDDDVVEKTLFWTSVANIEVAASHSGHWATYKGAQAYKRM